MRLCERTTIVEHGLCELDGEIYDHVSGGSLSNCLSTFVVLHLKDRARLIFFANAFLFCLCFGFYCHNRVFNFPLSIGLMHVM